MNKIQHFIKSTLLIYIIINSLNYFISSAFIFNCFTIYIFLYIIKILHFFTKNKHTKILVNNYKVNEFKTNLLVITNTNYRPHK